MQKIKVCHIITKLELGGAQQNTIFTVSHLNKQIFEPVLICGKGGILDDKTSKIKGLKVYFITHLVRPINILKDIVAFFQLLNILKTEKPDIVHTHSSKAGIIGRWAAYFAGVPVIIHTFHGFGFHDFQNLIIKNFFIFLEKITTKITNNFIAVTNEDIIKGLKYHIGKADNYTIIRSGIDTNYYKTFPEIHINQIKNNLNIPLNKNIITTIGPFKPQKNLMDFIRVAKIVSQKIPDTKFLIIGDGKQRPEIESLIKELNLIDKIKLLGWRNNIKELLYISNVFVMTSLWEGLPRSIIEAMCCGLPVVANAVDGIKEIIIDKKTGFLTKPFDIKNMSELIIYILNNKQQSSAIGETAKKTINKEFDINYMVELQEKLYLKHIKKQ